MNLNREVNSEEALADIPAAALQVHLQECKTGII